MPKAQKKFFCPPEGAFFFTLWVYTPNTQNFVENSKMGEKHRNNVDPQPDLRVGRWLMGA